MRDFIEIVWVLTPISNAALCLLLIWRGWSGRLQWLTIWTGSAVAADALFWAIHATRHALYAPLRIFTIYWLFNILMAFVIWEAWRVGIMWLEHLVSIQLIMSLVALIAYRSGDKWAIYDIECFNIIFNLLAIWYCILRFKGEPTYGPRQARS